MIVHADLLPVCLGISDGRDRVLSHRPPAGGESAIVGSLHQEWSEGSCQPAYPGKVVPQTGDAAGPGNQSGSYRIVSDRALLVC